MIQQQKDGRLLMQEAQRIVAKYGPTGLYRGLVRCAPALLLPRFESNSTAFHLLSSKNMFAVLSELHAPEA